MDDSERRPREKRFDDIGWGLLFLAVRRAGAAQGDGGVRVCGGGGRRNARPQRGPDVAGVEIRWFTIVLGATGLVAGAMALAGVKIDAFALFFVFLGVRDDRGRHR